MDVPNFEGLRGIAMNRMQAATRYAGIMAITVLISATVSVSRAYPEAYIGGQFGTTIAGNKLSHVDLTDFSPPGTMSDRSLSPSPLIGLKIGYYFPRARWFGLETEAYHMTPHIRHQPTTISIPNGAVLRDFGPVAGGTSQGTLTGDHFRVITFVPVNLMFRYYKTRLQPYFGFGPGVFMGRVTTTIPQFAGTQSSTRIGLNAKAGGEYFFTRHLSGFAEVKYNYARFDFSGNTNGGFSYRATYNPVILAVGLSYHF